MIRDARSTWRAIGSSPPGLRQRYDEEADEECAACARSVPFALTPVEDTALVLTFLQEHRHVDAGGRDSTLGSEGARLLERCTMRARAKPRQECAATQRQNQPPRESRARAYAARARRRATNKNTAYCVRGSSCVRRGGHAPSRFAFRYAASSACPLWSAQPSGGLWTFGSRRFGSAPREQPVDCVAETAKRRVMEGRSGIVEAGRNGVDVGAVVEQFLHRLLLSPLGGVNQRVVEEQTRIAHLIGGDAVECVER